jgi:ComF family protein
MSLLASLGALVQGLCPESCPRCGDESPAGFCLSCSDDFARIAAACPACGLPGAGHVCPARAPGWALDALRAPFLYPAPLSVYLQRLKFARQHRLGLALGNLLARELSAAAIGTSAVGTSAIDMSAPGMPAIDADVLVAVPLHRKRLRERTFNQADEFARPLARRFGLRLVASGIPRELHTPPQTGLARGERLVNLERAFRVRCRLDGARVAIVDDVITTGATVSALAAALRAAGAIRVEAWAVARTAGPGVAAAQAPRNR